MDDYTRLLQRKSRLWALGKELRPRLQELHCELFSQLIGSAAHGLKECVRLRRIRSIRVSELFAPGSTLLCTAGRYRNNGGSPCQLCLPRMSFGRNDQVPPEMYDDPYYRL